MFISIHLNAEDNSTWSGAQIYYSNINPHNKKIAQIFEQELKQTLNTQRKAKQDNTIYMHQRIKRPGILLEAGFLSNKAERQQLQTKTYQKKIAQTVKKAIIKYYN